MKLGKFTIHYLRGGNTNIDGGAMRRAQTIMDEKISSQ